jgi:hypothetical protein
MSRGLFTFIILLFISTSLWAGKFTVSGYVVDAATGETVIGVNVLIKGTARGAATDGNGYFTINGLEPDSYSLDFSHIAFEKKSVPVILTTKSIVLKEVALKPNVLRLQDVSIVAEKSELADPGLETGHRTMAAEAIRRIPTARNDVFKAIKYLPGIEGIDPLSPLYVVRGSDTGENLILLDGVPIYNPYHSVNSSGLFNVYAIKNVELMVGGFGVEYGGRNSSVLYITSREGNNQKLHGEISPGTGLSNGVVDFPIGRNATMMVSGRWFYDLFSRFLFDAPCYFYDMNSTLTWKLGSRNRLTLRYFHSFDDVDFKSQIYSNYLGTTFDTDFFDDYDFNYKTKWRNQAVSTMLKTVVSPTIYWQNQISYSSFTANNRSLMDYQFTGDDRRKTQLHMETDIRARIRDFGINSKLDIGLWEWNHVKIGGEFNSYRFENDVLVNGYSEGKILLKPDLIAGYLEDKVDVGFLSLRPGLRFSHFSSQKNWNQEFRVSAACQLAHNLKLKAAWGEYLQYIVSINTQEYELSQFLDTYYPLENKLPSASRQAILGLEADISQDMRLSLDIYHKDIQRTFTYDYNASQLQSASFLEKLRQGRGESFGFELLLNGRWGKTSGWINYGWSKSTRQFPHIMNNRVRLFDYDRPHSFKAVLNHQVNPALEFSGSLRIISGIPGTMETGYAAYFYYDPVTNEIGQWQQVLTPIKNNIRMPYYLQLDLGLKKRVRKGFGADLARYLGAERAYLNVSFGNLLFAFHRNVWYYIRDKNTLYGVGTNYIPEFSAGYSIQF